MRFTNIAVMFIDLVKSILETRSKEAVFAQALALFYSGFCMD
jgi:hypothetical protein